MKSLKINITRDCNISCSYCYMTHQDKYISLDEYKKCFDKLKPDKVSISGGEPLMHPELKSILLYSLENGADINIVTNGTLISENLSLFKEIGNMASELFRKIKVSLSFDGVTKSSMKNLRYISQYGIGCQIYVYPDQSKRDDFQLKLSEMKNNILSCQLLFPMPVGRNANVMYDKAAWKEAINTYKAICLNENISLYAQNAYPSLFIGENNNDYIENDGTFVDYDGSEYRCCFICEMNQSENKTVKSDCMVKAEKSCLALAALYGEDFRKREDAEISCPLNIVKVC